MVRPRALAAASAASLLLVSMASACSGAGSEAEDSFGAEGPAVDLACSGDREPGTKPAAFIDDCLTPSVGLVEVAGFGAGSGVIVERDGEKYVLTNLHVIDPDPTADVVFPGEESERIGDVDVVGVDKVSDLALLGPIETERPAVRIEGEDVTKGDEVYLVGYPGETEKEPETTISRGIVSRTRADEAFGNTYVQTDATIAGGQSGGALVDEDGTVIGVSGLGFAEEFALALAAKDVNEVIDSILGDGGDDYWTFPPGDGDAVGETSGTFDLVGADDLGLLYLDAVPEERTLEITLTPPEPAAIAVEDYDTAEPIFMDRRAFEAVLEASGTPGGDLDALARQQGIELGEPVAPGVYRVQVPAGMIAAITVGLVDLDAGATTVQWTSNLPLHFRADDETEVPLQVGEVHEGMLDLMETDATFSIELEEGTTYDVSVASNGGDPAVVVLAPGESYVDAWGGDDSDAGRYGTDVEEEFEPEVSGTYTVIVENYTGSAMAYRLGISEAGGE